MIAHVAMESPPPQLSAGDPRRHNPHMTESDLSLPLALLGGLSPQTFMRRHWHKKPLLIRQALPGVASPLDRDALAALAAQDGVESRLVRRVEGGGNAGWSMQSGPLAADALPPWREPGWTLLVQGVDLHADAAHALLQRFRFVPDARLDDLMISYATAGGGVGPHFDSYDVFLLQVQGRRRWQIGRTVDQTLVEGVPLKILQHFEAEEEWLLEPGDMLYLPPDWAHDGIAEGECITCSIGFRAASSGEFAREVLQRTLDGGDEGPAGARYRDPKQLATAAPGAIPEAMVDFAAAAVHELMADRQALACALGEWLSEPKADVWFEPGETLVPGAGVRLDRRTRMLWDRWHVFINSESFVAADEDAELMRRLADQRQLTAGAVQRLSPEALAMLEDWADAGWVHACTEGDAAADD